MNIYIDKNYLVAHNTIIAYTGDSAHIDITQGINGTQITQVGKAAFSELASLESIKLPYGTSRIEKKAFFNDHQLKKIEIPGTVKEFASDAFDGCSNLSELIWYDIKLSKKEYNDLIQGSSLTCNKIFVSHYIPQFVKESNFAWSPYSADEGNKAAVVVPKYIPVLFKQNDRKEDDTLQELYRSCENIYFSETGAAENEHDAFIKKIQSSETEQLSRISETRNDYAVKTDIPLKKEPTYIFTFDDKKTMQIEDMVYITAIIKIGVFFWQSAQKIIYDKKEYYVYRRHYLSATPQTEYIREDAAIYHNNKILTDRKEAQLVYGKYRLLSIL